MIVEIRDKAALTSLNPLEIAAHLRFNGWSESREKHVDASRWHIPDRDGDIIEVLLPYDKSIGDYIYRMSDLLKTLEYFEGRPQNVIFNDLKNTFSDIIRFVVPSSDFTDGSIPISIGSGAYQDINSIMMASACVSISKRPVIPQRKPTQAINYMNDVRIAPSELGSYVIPVISRVSPQLFRGEQMLLQPEEPFQRIVTTTLATSLVHLKQNSTDAIVNGDIELFNKGIQFGVNASLCESLANLGNNIKDGENLAINFSWSPSRPLIEHMANFVTLQPDVFPVLEEAAKYFKEISPVEMFKAIGQIIDLHREPTESIGKVKMQAFVENKLKKISFTIGDPIYSQLVQAHHDKKIVVCSGDLVKEGNSYKLIDPTDFSIAIDMDAD